MLYLCRGRVGTKFCNGAGVLHDVQNTRDCLPTMHCIVNGAGVRAGLRSSELPPRNPCTPLPPAPPLVERERITDHESSYNRAIVDSRWDDRMFQ